MTPKLKHRRKKEAPDVALQLLFYYKKHSPKPEAKLRSVNVAQGSKSAGPRLTTKFKLLEKGYLHFKPLFRFRITLK